MSGAEPAIGHLRSVFLFHCLILSPRVAFGYEHEKSEGFGPEPSTPF